MNFEVKYEFWGIFNPYLTEGLMIYNLLEYFFKIYFCFFNSQNKKDTNKRLPGLVISAFFKAIATPWRSAEPWRVLESLSKAGRNAHSNDPREILGVLVAPKAFSDGDAAWRFCWWPVEWLLPLFENDVNSLGFAWWWGWNWLFEVSDCRLTTSWIDDTGGIDIDEEVGTKEKTLKF